MRQRKPTPDAAKQNMPDSELSSRELQDKYGPEGWAPDDQLSSSQLKARHQGADMNGGMIFVVGLAVVGLIVLFVIKGQIIG